MKLNGKDVYLSFLKGDKGDQGKGAYDYAQEGGYTGTEQEFAKDLSDIATKTFVKENGGKIDAILVNDVEQPIVDKKIKLEVPTNEALEQKLDEADILNTFDIEEEYSDRQLYNANAIHELMGIFADEITMRDEIVEGKADKDASNLDATNVTQWQQKLSVATQQNLQDTVVMAQGYIDGEVKKLDTKIDEKADAKTFENVLLELNTVYMNGINGNTDRIETLEENKADQSSLDTTNTNLTALTTRVSDVETRNQEQDVSISWLNNHKVDKDGTKVLSSNDYTHEEKNKLFFIEKNAQVNVQADWNETDTTADAYIKNKPTIPDGLTVDSSLSTYSTNPVQNKIVTNEIMNKASTNYVDGELYKKVDKVDGKGLSTNDYTTTEKSKLAGIEEGADVSVQADWNVTNTNSKAYIKNKPTIPTGLTVDSELDAVSINPLENRVITYNFTMVDLAISRLDGEKVDIVNGKGLSTNDYTTEEKTKLSGIENGAQVNVQSDWNVTDTTSKAFIKNKPTIPTVTLYDSTGQNTDGAMTQKAVTDWTTVAGLNINYNKQEIDAIKTNLLPSKANTSNVSRLIADYTLSSASSSINLTGLDLMADGGVYDVVVHYKTNAGCDANVRVNNISSGVYRTIQLQGYTGGGVSFGGGKNSTNFPAGSVFANDSILSFTLSQTSTSFAQYTFTTVSNDSNTVYYRAGGGMVSLSSNITSITLNTGSPIQAGARIRIYARAK